MQVNLFEKAQHAIEYVAVAFVVAIAMLLVSKRTRKRSWRIVVGSSLIGGSIGYATSFIPFMEPYAIAIAIIATISGPATIMKFQDKALDEVYSEIKDLISRK